MDQNKINDKRLIQEFKGISFSGFKKTEVKKELLNNILEGKLEGANYWCAELVCCGAFMDIWEIILCITCKHIYISNLKIPMYLEKRYANFKELVNNGYIDNELAMRNNDKIRELFAEMVSVLTLSNKRNIIARSKLHKDIFDITNLQVKLKADHLNYSKDCFSRDDPKELQIAVNEFCFNIKNKNLLRCCFWLEWIIEFECRCNKKKLKCEADTRTFAPVISKYQKEIIWIVWDCLITYSKKQETYKQKLINSLLNLFSIRYSSGTKKKRIYLLYYAIIILVETLSVSQQKLIEDSTILQKIKDKINLIYRQIKKNEITPNTDYLFKGLNENNLEKSLSKIEQMNNIGFIPRMD